LAIPFLKYDLPDLANYKPFNEGYPITVMKSFPRYFFRLELFLLAMLVLSIIIWLFFYDCTDVVVKNEVYRSRQLSSAKLRYLIESERIRTIVNLRGTQPGETWYKQEKAVADQYGVTLTDIDFSANELPNVWEINHLYDVLKSAETPLLLHCKHGVDRTGMASALALIIKKDMPLGDAKRQFSWRYGVAPFFPSVGPLLFDAYEQWLGKNRFEYTRARLRHWLAKEYVDPNGNIRYYICKVNGQDPQSARFSEEYTFKIDTPVKQIRMIGWCFDFRNQALIPEIEIGLNPDKLKKTDVHVLRPGLLTMFDVRPELRDNMRTGWDVLLDVDGMAADCHNIFIRYTLKNAPLYTLKTRFRVCLGS